jgi:N-acetylneuraminate lyase
MAALALGATSAFGSSYNLAAAVSLRRMTAFTDGDLITAWAEQFCSVQLIELLVGVGYLAAAKTVRGFLGVDVGPARLPNANLTTEGITRLRAGLKQLDFFD